MTKQLIHHSIELSKEDDYLIGQWTISLILAVPSEYIATDIRTGFPNLISEIRLGIDNFILSKYHFYCQSIEINKFRPLIFMDNFLQSIEKPLVKFIERKYKLNLISLNVEIFTELEVNTFQIKTKDK